MNVRNNYEQTFALSTENPATGGAFSTSVASRRSSAALSSLPAAMFFWPLSEKALFAAGSAEQLNTTLCSQHLS